MPSALPYMTEGAIQVDGGFPLPTAAQCEKPALGVSYRESRVLRIPMSMSC